MGRFGKMDVRGLKELQERLDKLQGADVEAFCEECAKELAARLLAKVIKRTPVGQYPAGSGKTGGTLRRGWTAASHEDAAGGKSEGAAAYVEKLQISHAGDTYTVDIVNPVEYAPYVEFGHRTANHKGWVSGRFMLTISEQELQAIAPRVLEDKLKKFLEDAFK